MNVMCCKSLTVKFRLSKYICQGIKLLLSHFRNPLVTSLTDSFNITLQKMARCLVPSLVFIFGPFYFYFLFSHYNPIGSLFMGLSMSLAL